MIIGSRRLALLCALCLPAWGSGADAAPGEDNVSEGSGGAPDASSGSGGAGGGGAGTTTGSGGGARPDGGAATGGAAGNATDAAPAETGGVTSITVVMGGDIAEAGRTANARAIAAMIKGHSPAVTAVGLLGDNSRYDGSGGLLTHYQTYYQPAAEANWGQFDTIALPQSGNHEYNEADAQGYFDYFATRFSTIAAMPSYHGYAGEVGKGYYSVDLNGWHLVSLNSNCSEIAGGCAPGGAQQTWLQGDLAAHPSMPIIAMWHSPRYACGGDHTDDGAMQAFWADLYTARADFVFNGHNHYYQRWKALDAATPDAASEATSGLTEIVAGSYGVSPVDVCTTVDARVAKQVGGEASMGAFFLTLGSDGGYAFEYRLKSDGSLFDSGSGRSHHAR